MKYPPELLENVCVMTEGLMSFFSIDEVKEGFGYVVKYSTGRAECTYAVSSMRVGWVGTSVGMLWKCCVWLGRL